MGNRLGKLECIPNRRRELERQFIIIKVSVDAPADSRSLSLAYIGVGGPACSTVPAVTRSGSVSASIRVEARVLKCSRKVSNAEMLRSV